MIRRIFCVALITLGAGLDAYFYAFRFTADGLPVGVAIACALALEILLAFCVLHARGSKVFTGFAVALTLYAVIQTSAGQTFSLMTRDAGAGDTSATSKTLMAEETKNLARLDAEYSTITKQLSSIQTVEDRAVYGGTVYRMTARLAELSRERGASSARLSGLADKTLTISEGGTRLRVDITNNANAPAMSIDIGARAYSHQAASVMFARVLCICTGMRIMLHVYCISRPYMITHIRSTSYNISRDERASSGANTCI